MLIHFCWSDLISSRKLVHYMWMIRFNLNVSLSFSTQWLTETEDWRYACYLKLARRKQSEYTHSVRQANVTVGMVRTAAVDLVWVAGLLHHHRAGLHRLWSAGRQHEQRTHISISWKTLITTLHTVIVSLKHSEEVCVRQGSRLTAAGDKEEHGYTLKVDIK